MPLVKQAQNQNVTLIITNTVMKTFRFTLAFPNLILRYYVLIC